MAAAGALSLPLIPSEKEKPVNEEPDEKENEKGNNLSDKTGQYEDLKQPNSKIDSKSTESDLGTKRAHEDKVESPVKKPKYEEKPISEEGTFSSIQGGCMDRRVWTEKDEITVLNGMILFKNHSDLVAFHRFIDFKLEGDFNKGQLNDKIKRLKKRFLKRENGGEGPVLSNPHEDKLFELSKKIWGAKRAHEDKTESPVEKPKYEEKPKSEEGTFSSIQGGCMDRRTWSEKDEISVLNGMILFKNHSDVVAFHYFIEFKLEGNFNKGQLNDKMKRLKKRFLKRENGGPVLSNPHEDKLFELSKKIWGASVGMI